MGMQLRWERCAAVTVLAFLTHAIIKYVQLNGKCGRCEMSFMRPHYQPIDIIGGSRYRLLAYSEDGQFHSKRDNVYIYVPGNAASYQQVRSVGSELLKRCEECNVYTIDFKEELSAFDQQAIVRQSKFLHSVIEHLKGERASVKVTIIGHSMGAVVAKLVGCDCDVVVKIVDLAGPSSPPTPSPSLTFKHTECGEKLVKIIPGANDIEAVAECTKMAIRVDSIPLSWSDPHHQAMVWSHSLMRAVADHLIFGSSLSEFNLVFGNSSQSTRYCGERSGLSGTFMSNMKIGRHMDVFGENVTVSVIPGRYIPAQSGRVKSVIPEYLTLISGHQITIKEYCKQNENPVEDNPRLAEYQRDGSPFADYLTALGEEREKYIEQVTLFQKTRYLLPHAVYGKSDDTVLVSVELSGGQMIHPEHRMLSGEFGKYTITSIDKQVHLHLDISRTLTHWINMNKAAFHKGLILGFNRRTPFIYTLLLALLVISWSAAGSGIVTALVGYSAGHSLYTLFYGQRPKFTPIYKYADDLTGFKGLCAVMSVVSIMLPYPMGMLTCVPVFIVALTDKNKRYKAIQLTLALLFEIICGVAAVINVCRSRQYSLGPIVYRVVPVLVNMSMAMHVRSFIFMPAVTMLPNMTLATSITAFICGWCAADHERNQIKNMRVK